MGTPSGYLRRRPGHQPSWIAGFGVGWPWLLDCSRHRRGFVAEEKVSWLETYRGFVYRWEVDHNDHLTVAYYLARVADAGLGLLEALGLGPGYMKRSGRGCVTSDCYVRYQRELRVGDILHIGSGGIRAERDTLVLGHKVFNSENGEVCTTVEQSVRHVDLKRRAAARLTPAQRRVAEGRHVPWDGPPREQRPRPRGLAGFRQTARDTVEPSKLDVFGQSGLAHYIHRFSAANGHAIAAFGMTPGYQREQRRGFSTFEFQLAIGGALCPGDPVRVQSALLHVGTSSLRLLHVMSNERNGERVATLEQLGVHLDMDARKSTPLSDELRARARAVLLTLGKLAHEVHDLVVGRRVRLPRRGGVRGLVAARLCDRRRGAPAAAPAPPMTPPRLAHRRGLARLRRRGAGERAGGEP